MNEEQLISHKYLVDKAARWLKRHERTLVVPNCSVIAKEIVCSSSTGEIPDVIGFSSSQSVLIEVKVSRADFLRDKKKLFREAQYLGMGQLRFYCCPEGLIKPNELPENWGLLYYTETISIEKEAIHQETNLHCERSILFSMLRRLAT